MQRGDVEPFRRGNKKIFMARRSKQLSNPFSTGGGGAHFEAQVQASFVTLMLTGGFAPCLPCWPISKIKLQGKYAGFDTDDLIVFVEKPDGGQTRKLLGQIKHSVSISEKDKVFGEVIQAAWNDFSDPDIFTKNSDVIALVTGPLSATDVDDVRTILDWARHAEDFDDLENKVNLAQFSSQQKQNKFQAFKKKLDSANDGNVVAKDIFFDFLRHFHLLGYDLDLKAGVALSLLQSLIGQYAPDNPHLLWSRIVEEVQSANKNAGTLTRESVSEELLHVFKQRTLVAIPVEFSETEFSSTPQEWNQHKYASALTVVNLIGAWNEKSEPDTKIIHKLANDEYVSWLPKVRELLQLPASPVALKNGRWHVVDRKALWAELGARLFDSSLDDFKECAVRILIERDPQFELPAHERYAASIHEKVLIHSNELRKGVAEGLALLGSQPDFLINCSKGKPEFIAALAVQDIFSEADWVLWGSLNTLLPTLAEAAPDVFLDATERALTQSPSPFSELFLQEDNGIFGRNYLTGLLWALETLGWADKFLVRVTIALGELAALDPGGKWGNRPINSLTTIFLPWLPQTTASIEKRRAALQTLQKEFPAIAWKLLLSLLPNQTQTSSGTHKPSWRSFISDDWEKNVSQGEYREQVASYADLAISMAGDDAGRLTELIGRLPNFPKASFEKILDHLSTDAFCKKTEDERLGPWVGLTKLISKHSRFPDAQWALKTDVISKIQTVAEKLSPKNPLNLYRRLFANSDFDLYEENDNWEAQQQNLEELRQKAIKEILSYGGIQSVIQFADTVASPSKVGFSLGTVANNPIDEVILPELLDAENKLALFANYYVRSRQRTTGWEWVDGLDKSGWSMKQIGQFLSYLPFAKETWGRVPVWLGKAEKEYWSRTDINAYYAEAEIEIAIDKLIEHGRPNAAIDCLHGMYQNKHVLDKPRSVKALLNAISSSEHSNSINTYSIVEIIKALQDDPATDEENLFHVEWAYLPILDHDQGATPKLLERKLASDPKFFCEVIRLIYRSENERKSEREPSAQESKIATNAWRLLHEWETPPGIHPSEPFSKERLHKWLGEAKDLCIKSGHWQVALSHIGQVLYFSPADPNGLWIDQSAAEALNGKDTDKMRSGFRMRAINSRGVHWVDPTAKPELELAMEYRKKADGVENSGYQRFAVTLRGLAEHFDREANQIISENKKTDGNPE